MEAVLRLDLAVSSIFDRSSSLVSICSEQEATESTIAKIAAECIQVLSSAVSARRELKLVSAALERQERCREMVVELRALAQGQRETIEALRRKPQLSSVAINTEDDPVQGRAEELQRLLAEREAAEVVMQERVSALEAETRKLKEIVKQSVLLLEAKQVRWIHHWDTLLVPDTSQRQLEFVEERHRRHMQLSEVRTTPADTSDGHQEGMAASRRFHSDLESARPSRRHPSGRKGRATVFHIEPRLTVTSPQTHVHRLQSPSIACGLLQGLLRWERKQGELVTPPKRWTGLGKRGLITPT